MDDRRVVLRRGFASLLALVGAGEATCAQDLLEQTALEAFVETVHEVREVRGIGPGKQLAFRLAKSRDLAPTLVGSWPRIELDATSFAALGLLPAKLDAKRKFGQVQAQMLSIGYDSKTASVAIPEETKKLGRYVAKLLAAQAIGRAIDTERYDIDARMERAKTFDERFVLAALRDGAALLTMSEWAVTKRDGWTMPERLGLQSWERARNDASTRAPRFFSTMLASGLLGRNFYAQSKNGASSLLPTISSGTSKRIESVFRDLPASSEQILHPDKYWSSDRDEPVTLKGEDALLHALSALAQSELTDVNTLGEFGCGIAATPLLQRAIAKVLDKRIGTSVYWSPRASDGWAGDRLYVFGQGENASVAWVTMWDAEADASEFSGVFGSGNAKRAKLETYAEGRIAIFASGKLATRARDIHRAVIEHGKPCRGDRSFDVFDRAAAPQK
ncbi:MAG: hypothetical protein KDC95_13750 [Planctomycetes bacterium]|nr:hypothetical protein [Planctomycetota bacterium]